MINLDLYRVFHTVAKYGSITKAADELFISQPAVSQAIKQLELQLGGALFARVSRGMQLTDTGTRLYDIVDRAIKMLEGAEDKMNELKNVATGSLRISAAEVSSLVFGSLLPSVEPYNRYLDGTLPHEELPLPSEVGCPEDAVYLAASPFYYFRGVVCVTAD